VQVPRFVSTWKVAELFKKELAGGHFRNIAGVLVMHAQPAGAVEQPLTFTTAKQFGFIANLARRALSWEEGQTGAVVTAGGRGAKFHNVMPATSTTSVNRDLRKGEGDVHATTALHPLRDEVDYQPRDEDGGVDE